MPWILERGRDYFQSGSVSDLEVSDSLITAQVTGSEDYTVEIHVSDGFPADMFCSCPYADGGENCKHMAAALFAAERAEYTFDESPNEQEEWEDALENLTQEQLRQLIRDLAIDNRKLQKRLIRMGTAKDSPEAILNWKEEIMELVWEVADEEHDFIDYDHAYNLMVDICEYFQRHFRPLMRRGAVMDAFDLVTTVYITVMELDMDDSDGGLSLVVSDCNEAWGEIFTAANDEQKIEIYQQFWVMQGLREWAYGTDMLVDFFLRLDWSEELQHQNLVKLDLEIARANRKDYWLSGYLSHRERIMRNLGASEEEVVSFWKAHSDIPAAKERLLEIYTASDPDAAIALLLRSKQEDPCNTAHSEKLIELYHRTKRQNEYEAELRFLVVKRRHIRVPYLRLLKDAVSDEEWQAIAEELLTLSRYWHERFTILSFEERYEQLAAEIVKASDLHGLNEYEHALRTWSAEQTRDCYVAVLKRAMEQSPDRKQHRSLIQYLSKLQSYPDGTAAAKALADYWRTRHSNRPAMKDELRKAGF